MATSLFSWVINTIRVLRLMPFDTATEGGRSQERYRRIAWTGVSAATAKGSTVLAMLVSVPITLAYLGPERFGLWMAVSTAVAMLHFADFGLSNGLVNAVAKAKGDEDPAAMQGIVTNGLVMLCMTGTAVVTVYAILHDIVPWSSLFNVESALAASESNQLVLVLVACFVANLAFGMTQKIQLGLQRGYLANAWETIGSISGLVGVIVAVQLGASLPTIALAMAGAPVLARALNTLIFFGIQMPTLRPQWRLIARSTIAGLLRIGGLFFVLQLAVILAFQADNVIIAHLLGAEAVAAYDIAFKLAMLPVMFISFVVVAQWPAYAEAVGRGDAEWIRSTFARTLRRSLGLALAFAIPFVLFGADFIRLWAGADVVPDRFLLVCLGTWSVLSAAGAAIAALLNGMHIITFQAIHSSIMAIINFALSIYLVQRIGPAGAALGSIIAYSTITLVPCWIFIRRMFTRDLPSLPNHRESKVPAAASGQGRR